MEKSTIIDPGIFHGCGNLPVGGAGNGGRSGGDGKQYRGRVYGPLDEHPDSGNRIKER